MLTALFFALWIVLNGRWTLELCCFGLVIAPVLSVFTKKYLLNQPLFKRPFPLKNIPQYARYLLLLIKEITLANKAVLHFILSSKHVVQPVLAPFHTRLKNPVHQVVLADCITLTPGTITVSLEKNCYLVHCLDDSFVDGLVDSSFETRLLALETKEEAAC